MSLVAEAAAKSAELLHRALLPAGFVASPSFDHYGAVWARDAALACLGASASGDEELASGTEATLRTLGTLAAPTGQIPNAYWPSREYWDWGEAGSTDASAWFVIALGQHVAATGRAAVAEELWPAALRALQWLTAQDATGTGLIESPAAGDWMDSSLNRSGRVFHVNVLHHWAAETAALMAGRLGFSPPVDPKPIATAVDLLFWPRDDADLASLTSAPYPQGTEAQFPHPLAAGEYGRLASHRRRHYLAGVSFGRFTDRCDVLAHCLGIASGLITGERAATVLDYLDGTGCDDPYPSRTWPEPFLPGDPDTLLDETADELQAPQWRNPPGDYHNGAVWPYVGAIHAAAAAVAGRLDRASELLRGTAAANKLDGWGFHEWIRVPDGEPMGPRDQTWNAGAFLWAQALLAG